MKLKAVSRILPALLLIGILTLVFNVQPISAVESPYIAVVPDSLVDPSLTPGENFTVSIYTDYNGSDITAWQFSLSYNPSVLHGVTVVNGDLITKAKDPSAMFLSGTFDNTAGILTFTCAVFNFTFPPAPLTSGPGTLANVTFEVVGMGDSPITLGDETILFGYTEGGYGDAYHIIHGLTHPDHIQHGYFCNTVGPVIHDIAVVSVTPSPTSVELGDLVNIMVVVENQGMENETFDVTVYYDATTIETQSVSSLAVGANTFLTFVWNTTEVYPLDILYKIEATASTVPGETDTDDNTLVSLSRVRVYTSPYIAVVPHCTVDPSLTPGKNYTVSIRTDYNGTDVWGWQLTLSYNPNVLHGVAVTNGDLITTDKDPSAMFLSGTFDNTAGKLELTLAFFFYTTKPVPLTSGPGTLANVTFTVVGIGDSDIILGDETKLVGFTEGGYGDVYEIVSDWQPDIGHILPGYFRNTAETVTHDVAVTHVIPDLTLVEQGELVNVTVVVENQGTVSETFTVSAYYDRYHPNYLIGKRTVHNCSAGANLTLTFGWDTTFVLPGDYTITAVASELPGETDTEDNTLQSDEMVTVLPAHVLPLAFFTYSPSDPVVGETMTFDASPSYDLDGFIVSYEWDFGDNTTEIYKDENITHITAHAFDQGGTYTVKLTVTDNDGLTSTATARITVIQAEPTPTISVYPSISTALVGEIFTVNITVTDIVISETPPVSKGLFGWEAWMTFDSDVLHAVNATEGPFLESAGYPTLWLSRINNTEGTVRVGATIQFWNPPYPENGSVGSGVLATLTFEVVSEGKTSLHFETPIDVAKTNLYTIIANNVAKLLFTAEDGLFLSAPAPEIFVWPPISMAEVGQTLTININITNVTWENSNDSGVYGWQFYMSFDPEVLNATSVMEGPWLKSTGEETLFAENIFNEEGYLIAINFLIDFPDTGVVGSGTLANVTFDVLDTGTCPLDLYQTKLRAAWEIEPGIWDVFAVDHTAVGGFFTSLLGSPVASFTWEPEAPSVGETVTFNASASYDPDGTIVSWNWSFGDDTFGSGMIVDHVYASTGNYTAILVVIDNEGLNDTSAAVITVSAVGVHDIAIVSATASPTQVTAGEFVTITGTVVNEGDFSEIFSLTVYYDSTMISAYNATLDAGGSTTWAFTWDTTGVPSGTYTIRAEAIVVEGEVDISDNMLVDGTVTVTSLPAPPILSIKLCGEHDYPIMENVKVRLAALVKDAATMEPVSDANVTVEIYDPNGVLWVSDMMVEKLAGTGIYEWESEGTIRQLRLAKGVYLVHVQASHQGGPTASDILEFHLDPPAEGTNQTLYPIAFTAVALVGLAGLILERRKIANRLRQLKSHN